MVPVVEADFCEAMRHAVWAVAVLPTRELPEAWERADKARSIRARADREFCRWGLVRRRLISQTVLIAEGLPIAGGCDQQGRRVRRERTCMLYNTA